MRRRKAKEKMPKSVGQSRWKEFVDCRFLRNVGAPEEKMRQQKQKIMNQTYHTPVSAQREQWTSVAAESYKTIVARKL